MQLKKIQSPSQYLIAIYLVQLLFFLLMVKSITFGILFVIFLVAPFLLYIYPELGVCFGLTGNILLYILFDRLQLNIPAPVILMNLLLFGGTVAVIWWKLGRIQLPKDLVYKLNWIILALLVVGLLYSSNKSYGATKTAFFILVNLPLYVVASLFNEKREMIERVLHFMLLLGAILGMYCFIQPQAYYFDYVRYTVSESVNPIFLSRSLGLSIVAGLFFVFGTARLWPKIIFLFLLPILLQPMIWTGSRGPLLGVLLMILFFFLLQPKLGLTPKIIITAFGVLLGIVFLIQFAGTIMERLATPLTEETSAAFRLLAWYQALLDFKASPIFGIGTGSFLLETPWVPLIYPHNLILELLAESGIFGFLAIIFFIFYIFKYSYITIRSASTRRETQLAIVLLCMFCYVLFNAMLSGEISKNEMVWGVAGLIVANFHYKERNEKGTIDHV